ncbi:Protein CBG06000 [Caenorhabditis briggsae]|uniref:Protein CBG06000 n=1 Tax=Caenorhabditis briggsae TaxID=6238 RepID=A8X152_CAEBR|nr:Protein CBG06000 [Caenorhabditis briggsae]CAP26362.2 Protein CBG06000 [Caenorhabditis briggsae]
MTRHKCKDCGKSFDLKRYLTKHELRMHNNPNKSEETVQSTEPLKCSMCEKVAFNHSRNLTTQAEGISTSVSSTTTSNDMCDHCGASFTRPADLVAHQTACLKKVALICVPCETFFKQRVEVRKCGYCDLENPSDDHVSEFHWRRLKRTIPRRVAEKLMKTKHKEIPSALEEKQVEEGNLEVEEIDDCETGLNLFEQPIFNDQRSNKIEGEDSLFDFSEPSTSQLGFNSTMFDEEDDRPEDYLSFSICPKDTDVPFHLRGRLPPELVSLFPELEDTSIVLLNATPLPMCRMTIRVPVSIPQSCDNEQKMRAWQKSIIKLEDDEPTNLI